MLQRRRYRAAVSTWLTAGAPAPYWPALPALTPAVAQPALTGLELVASDVNGEVDPVFGSNWGYHQNWDVELADGTLYCVYPRTKSFGATAAQDVVEAVVRMRTPLGVWSTVAALETVDDFHLVADQVAQTVHLVHARRTAGAPVMSVVSFPGGAQADVPGDWTTYARPGSGRYWVARMSTDGMLGIKISVDGGAGEPTETTTNRFIFGQRVNGAWVWTTQRSQAVGVRRGYDFLFLGYGDRLNVQGLGAWNPHREDYPLALAGGGVDYLFSGITHYSLGASDTAPYAQGVVQQPQPQASAGVNPQSRLNSALRHALDGRLFASYYVFNSSAKANGWWLLVLSADGQTVLADVHLSAAGKVPANSKVYLTQDGAGALYAVHFGPDVTATTLRVFKLTETAANVFSVPNLAATPDIAPATFGGLRAHVLRVQQLAAGARLASNWVRLSFTVAEADYPAGGAIYPTDPGYGRNKARLYTAKLQLT